MGLDSEIKLTKEELDNIERCFEKDRARITQQFGYDDDADMSLHLFKTFKQQILMNQEIAERLRERQDYHLLCEGKFESGSEIARYHHAIWEELNQIEKG